MGESLPNITGSFRVTSCFCGGLYTPSGALSGTKNSGKQTWGSGSGANYDLSVAFSATDSSSVYQDNVTIKPSSTSALMIVKY